MQISSWARPGLLIGAGLATCTASVVANASAHLALPENVLIASGLSTAFVAKFTLFIAVLLIGTIACGKLLRMLFRLPLIAGQIVGGIILGPSLINVKAWSLFQEPLEVVDRTSGLVYSIVSSDLFLFFVILLSAAFTVSYLLWIAGHETDIQDILKVGVTATAAGLLGAVIPIGMIGAFLLYGWSGYSEAQAVAIGIIFAATSVSIPVAMLFSQNKMHLRSSKATLGAAIIDDIFSVILLSIFMICLQAGTFGDVEGFVRPEHGASLSQALLYMVVSFGIIFFAGYWAVPPIIKFFKHRHMSHLIAPAATAIMLLYFSFAELVGGLAGITGAYFAGLFHRMGDHQHTAEKTISPYVNSFLLPLFLGSIGLQVNITLLSREQWMVVLALLALAIVSKIGACFVATGLSNALGGRRHVRWTRLESYLFGASMVARGEVGLVVATILRGTSLLTDEHYIIAVVVIVLTTIVTPILLAFGFARLDKKSVSSASAEEFSITIGPFKVVGTMQMFNVINGIVEADRTFNTTVTFSEGLKIINLQGYDVKIILDPEIGITFKGNRKNIQHVLRLVKNRVASEVEGIHLS